MNQQEFLAVRFHMSLKDKTTHPLYDDAKKSQLRYIVHKADGVSAHLRNGYEDPDAKQENDEDFAAKFVSALKTIGITVVDHETKKEMQKGDLEEYLRGSLVEHALNDDRLEDAFKTPICNKNGYAEQMPVIGTYYGYGQTEDGVKILTKKVQNPLLRFIQNTWMIRHWYGIHQSRNCLCMSQTLNVQPLLLREAVGSMPRG